MEIVYLIVIILFYASTLYYLSNIQKANKKAEIERLREVVKAIKSRDVVQYEEVLPPLTEEKIKEIIQDELVDLSEISPEELLKARGK